MCHRSHKGSNVRRDEVSRDAPRGDGGPRRRRRAGAEAGRGAHRGRRLRHLRQRPALRPPRPGDDGGDVADRGHAGHRAARRRTSRRTCSWATSSAAASSTSARTPTGPAPDTYVTSVPIMVTATGIQNLAYTNLLPCGYSDRMLLSSLLTLPVPNGLAPTHAALTEPMAVGLHAVNRSGLQAGDGAVVVGCGPVGLAVIAALRLLGVAPIVAADLSPARRALAVTMGAHEVVDPREETAFAAWDARRRRSPDGRVRGRRRARHDRRADARRAAAEPHRRRRRVHAARRADADVRHRQGAQPAVRARLHARGVRRQPAARSPRAPSTWRR